MSIIKYNCLSKMTKRIIILNLFFTGMLYSQFYDVNLSYENNISIKDEHKYILEEFNNRVLDYLKYTKYAQEYDFLDIPLDINIIYHKINLIDENTYEGFECQILLTNNKDQYFITRNITIPYYKGRDIYHNSTQFDPIASVFDYYAYIFTANRLDTYGEYLGEQYYNLAYDLSNKGIETNNARQWEINKKLIETILDNTHLRSIKYTFFNIMDSINDEKNDLTFLKESLHTIVDNLNIIYEKHGYEKHTLKFIQAYNLELSDLFEIFEIKNGIESLIKFDYKNENLYKKLLNE